MTGWHITGDDAADALLESDPLAVLIAEVLDSQIPVERAFEGPKLLADRMGGLDVHRIADMDPAAFEELFRAHPAVHRFVASMAETVQRLCQAIVADYAGEPARIWTDGAPTAAEVLRRLEALPGYGREKSRVVLAILGKRLGVRLPGWIEVSKPFGDPGVFHSAADIVDRHSLELFRTEGKTTPRPRFSS